MLLSETELRSALEPLLNRVLAERLRYFQLQLEPRLQALLTDTLHQDSGLLPNASLQRLLAAPDAGRAFDVFFELARAFAPAPVALLVLHRGRTAIWKSDGLSAAPSTPSLEGEERIAIRVRGTAVGLLVWEGATGLDEIRRHCLQTLAHILSLVLLRQAVPAKATAAVVTSTSAADTSKPLRAAPAGASAEQSFAHLLLEDLELYLAHERAGELRAARQAKDLGVFAPELTRCRAAFQRRFPQRPEVIETAIAELLATP